MTLYKKIILYADVVKLVNTRDSKSRAARLVGSSPTIGTRVPFGTEQAQSYIKLSKLNSIKKQE